MRNEDRVTQVESAPDTERNPPLSSSTEHISVDVASLDMAALDAARDHSTVPPPESRGTTRADNLRSTQKSSVHSEQPQRPARFDGSSSPSQQHGQEPAESHTTLQSMRRPELVPGAVPHTRRFLSIEHELADVGTLLKVLEKRVERAERRLFFAWCAAVLAVLVAGAAIAL